MGDFTEAIRLEPEVAEGFTHRGAVRRSAGDLEGALQDLDEVVRLKPNLADAFVNRGIVRRENGDMDGSLHDFNEALRLAPGSPKAFHGRADTLRVSGDPDGAVKDYTEAIRLKHDYASAFTNRGVYSPIKATPTARFEILTRPFAFSLTMPSLSTAGVWRVVPRATRRAQFRTAPKPCDLDTYPRGRKSGRAVGR